MSEVSTTAGTSASDRQPLPALLRGDVPRRLDADVRVDLLKIAPRLAIVSVVIVILHLFFVVLRHVYDMDYVMGLSPLFDMWGERSIPAYFTALLWVLAALLLTVCGLADPPARRRWFLLALVALFLSIDENLALHERLIHPLRGVMDTATGILFFPWFLPYMAVVAVLAVAYIPFLRALPRRTALGILIAGTVFLSGSVGFEMIEGIYFEPDPFGRTPLLDTLVVIEETLEIVGLLLFVHTLGWHLQVWGRSTLRLGRSG